MPTNAWRRVQIMTTATQVTGMKAAGGADVGVPAGQRGLIWIDLAELTDFIRFGWGPTLTISGPNAGPRLTASMSPVIFDISGGDLGVQKDLWMIANSGTQNVYISEHRGLIFGPFV